MAVGAVSAETLCFRIVFETAPYLSFRSLAFGHENEDSSPTVFGHGHEKALGVLGVLKTWSFSPFAEIEGLWPVPAQTRGGCDIF